jgi:hypothetical protein
MSNPIHNLSDLLFKGFNPEETTINLIETAGFYLDSNMITTTIPFDIASAGVVSAGDDYFIHRDMDQTDQEIYKSYPECQGRAEIDTGSNGVITILTSRKNLYKIDNKNVLTREEFSFEFSGCLSFKNQLIIYTKAFIMWFKAGSVNVKEELSINNLLEGRYDFPENITILKVVARMNDIFVFTTIGIYRGTPNEYGFSFSMFFQTPLSISVQTSGDSFPDYQGLFHATVNNDEVYYIDFITNELKRITDKLEILGYQNLIKPTATKPFIRKILSTGRPRQILLLTRDRVRPDFGTRLYLLNNNYMSLIGKAMDIRLKGNLLVGLDLSVSLPSISFKKISIDEGFLSIKYDCLHIAANDHHGINVTIGTDKKKIPFIKPFVRINKVAHGLDFNLVFDSLALYEKHIDIMNLFMTYSVNNQRYAQEYFLEKNRKDVK